MSSGEDTLRPEYPAELIKSGIRGKYAARYQEGINIMQAIELDATIDQDGVLHYKLPEQYRHWFGAKVRIIVLLNDVDDVGPSDKAQTESNSCVSPSSDFGTSEPFDYTEWQRALWEDKSVEEISRMAMTHRDTDKE
jgi:hypothetical protein